MFDLVKLEVICQKNVMFNEKNLGTTLLVSYSSKLSRNLVKILGNVESIDLHSELTILFF